MKKKLIITFRLINFTLLQMGISPKKALIFFKGMPKYISDLIKFRKEFKGNFELLPCLHDWNEEGGNTKGEYFLQDLHVARLIFQTNPSKHLDIGSSVEGFVAHVASFRIIYILDVRPISSEIPGIIFNTFDLSSTIDHKDHGSYDSISCLHALEHFGLGRYGDKIDVNGHIKGLTNMSKLLKNYGLLYLSVPIGIERVEFNANRVFNPKNIIEICLPLGLILNKFILIQNSVVTNYENILDVDFDSLANQRYSLGIFIFQLKN